MSSPNWFGYPDYSFFPTYHIEEDAFCDSDSELRRAVKSSSLESVKKLIIRDLLEINTPDFKGRTLLHDAVVSDERSEISRLLISAGAIVDYKTPNGQAPLYIACKYGCEETVKLLIEAGCNINYHSAVDIDYGRSHLKFTPLHIACTRRNLTIIKLLLENNADINAEDDEGRTPFYFAMDAYNLASVNILIDAGADLKLPDRHGFTSLHYACMLGKLDIFNALFEQIRCDESALNYQSPDGCTPLMCTMQYKQYFMAEKLIMCGVDTTVVDSDRLLALHMAIRCGYRYFKLLLEHTPKEVIEKYASFGCSRPTCRSLPCVVVDNADFECLELLYKCGLSEAVLKCTDEKRGHIVSPIGYLMLHDSSWFDREREIKFLELFLSHDFLMDPAYEEEYEAFGDDEPIDNYLEYPKKAISPIEAIFLNHDSSHCECNCEEFFSMILSKIASPDKILPCKSSNQLRLFLKAARHGFVGGLSLLRYSVSVEPDDVLELLLKDIVHPMYQWTGNEAIGIEFLFDRCTTNFMSKFRKIRRSLSEPSDPDLKEEYYSFLGMFDMVMSETDQRVISLKKMCRFTVRKYFCEQAEVSSQNYGSYFSSIGLPSTLLRYLLDTEDFERI